MGCTKSRVGPIPAKKGTKRNHSPHCRNSELNSNCNERMWRRMVRSRTVKVTPAKSHMGGGDNPEYEDKQTINANFHPKSGLESFLYTSNRPHRDDGGPTGASNAPKLGNKYPAMLTKAQLSQIQSNILRELRDSGILNGQASPSGAVSFTVADPAVSGDNLRPSCLPPARLAKLDKTSSMPDPQKAEKLKKNLEAAEKRRKVKQDAMRERLRAHSRLGFQHSEVAAQAERALQQRVADNIIEKEQAFNKRVEKLNGERLERIRAMSRKEHHAKEVVDFLDKECQKRAAETVDKKQRVVLTNIQRQKRLRANRVRLNQKHRQNVRHSVARRLANQEEQAEMAMNYEIETAKDSGDEGDFEQELQWIM